MLSTMFYAVCDIRICRVPWVWKPKVVTGGRTTRSSVAGKRWAEKSDPVWLRRKQEPIRQWVTVADEK